MKKIILSAVLVLSSTAAFAGPNCDSYIKEVDAMVNIAREHVKNPDELKMIDDQMGQMKTMLDSIPEEQREAACAQALEQVPMMKQMINQAVEQMKAEG
ncbi:DUF5339 family protein [Thorsellia anophelis]|uniref:Uncharacterized protein n=1 Tax=Thorsellia anophelis DSM 18579 TaxID=1123402 RepID=A0A1H9ZPH3_9GAMM|nr:DUF5339 family protein [Thorsellia anophelis]SES83572.1 hypothetical protein SAMN02583745_00637 [Thorsellia anophelis DSM 18579]